MHSLCDRNKALLSVTGNTGTTKPGQTEARQALDTPAICPRTLLTRVPVVLHRLLDRKPAAPILVGGSSLLGAWNALKWYLAGLTNSSLNAMKVGQQKCRPYRKIGIERERRRHCIRWCPLGKSRPNSKDALDVTSGTSLVPSHLQHYISHLTMKITSRLDEEPRLIGKVACSSWAQDVRVVAVPAEPAPQILPLVAKKAS